MSHRVSKSDPFFPAVCRNSQFEVDRTNKQTPNSQNLSSLHQPTSPHESSRIKIQPIHQVFKANTTPPSCISPVQFYTAVSPTTSTPQPPKCIMDARKTPITEICWAISLDHINGTPWSNSTSITGFDPFPIHPPNLLSDCPFVAATMQSKVASTFSRAIDRQTSANFIVGIERHQICHRKRHDRCPIAGSIQRFGPKVFAVETDDEEDLMQFPDRASWYEAAWAAVDMPEWTPAEFVSSTQLTLDLRLVELKIEISRQRVALLNAYKFVGQKACIRVGNGAETEIAVATAPFPQSLNNDPLFKLRGDLSANETKAVEEELSVKGELSLLVSEKDAPDVYNLDEDDEIFAGPFTGEGLDLKPIAAIYTFPTIVIFAEGKGIATARALVTATMDVPSLMAKFRTVVKLYYKAPNEQSLLFRDEFDAWKELGVEVVTTTSSFQDAFDDDDTLVYEPAETAAIILTGGDEEADKKAHDVCREAEITEIVSDMREQLPTVFIKTGEGQV